MKTNELFENIEKLAAVSDEALDNAYHYGRSTPGANFGWLANIESAKAASKLINAGETDIEVIADAIHDGWNITAIADYNGTLQLDTPTPDEKKAKRYGCKWGLCLLDSLSTSIFDIDKSNWYCSLGVDTRGSDNRI